MAGYILKIVVEDTHPPVWRRVIIPDRISFYELHLVIQVLFGWEDCHWHNFSIPSENIVIGEEADAGFLTLHYPEDRTLVECFLLNYRSVRYTYDFGDNWRHRVIFEKIDESYNKRYAVLLKAKGDNFEEDSGGVWASVGNEESRMPFDAQAVTEDLETLSFSAHENLSTDINSAYFPDADPDDMQEEMDRFFSSLLEQLDTDSSSENKRNLSAMALKVEGWYRFQRECLLQSKGEKEKDYILEIDSGTRCCAELLQDLGLQEAKDYCKYLQIPHVDSWTRVQLTDAVAQEFYRHPEYLLYVLQESEYKEYLRLAELPNGRLKELPDADTVIKALGIGLADIQIEKRGEQTRATLTFATDIRPLLHGLSGASKKQTYRNLERVSERLKTLLNVYGLVDFESLQSMYQSVYHNVIAPEDFRRYIYWHGRFNNLLQTLYRADTGKSYAAALQLDADYVMDGMLRYAPDLEYISYSDRELREMAESICGRIEWAEELFDTLVYEIDLPEQTADILIEHLFPLVQEGRPLHYVTDVMLHMLRLMSVKPGLFEVCDFWCDLAGMLLEAELPMLKGRSRQRYAKEKGISPWEMGMLEEEETSVCEKECPMYAFERPIQEAMFRAVNFGNEQDMEMLLEYMQKENVCSEEFLYLLARANIINNRFSEAEPLIRQLKKSSLRGKKGAAELREMLDEGMDVSEEPKEVYPEFVWDNWAEPAVKPYVRETPKIGRNDPCPCGSGKKYKKCCGK